MKKSLFSYCAAACLVAVLWINLHLKDGASLAHAELAAPAATASRATVARPLMISNNEWTFNLNNVCTSGGISVYHVLGTKDPMMLSMPGLDATLTGLVEGGTWIKTGMPTYINLNTVASARVTNFSPRELEITFADGFKEKLTGDDAKLFVDAAAKLATTK